MRSERVGEMKKRGRYGQVVMAGAGVVGLLISTTTMEAREEVASAGLWEYHFSVDACDVTGLDKSVWERAAREVDTIYEQVEARIDWNFGCESAPIATGDVSRARILLMDWLPRFVLKRFRHEKKRDNLMGYVLTPVGGRPGPLIYIARRAVERNARDFGEEFVRARLAKALGRVMAHELAHRFLQSGHVDEGILKERFARRYLVEPNNSSLYFTVEQSLYLRSVGERRLASGNRPRRAPPRPRRKRGSLFKPGNDPPPRIQRGNARSCSCLCWTLRETPQRVPRDLRHIIQVDGGVPVDCGARTTSCSWPWLD